VGAGCAVLRLERPQAELERARELVKRVDKDVWLAGNDMSYEGHWKWAKGSLDDDWNTFINAGGDVGLEFAWKDGSPHRNAPNRKTGKLLWDEEDCLFMRDDSDFDDYECDKDRYVLCDDGTD